MRSIIAFVIAAAALTSSGCMSDRTKNMASTCQDLLESTDQSNVKRFIREAEEQLAFLKEPQNKITIALAEIQDKDARKYGPVLQGCLEQLKSRQS